MNTEFMIDVNHLKAKIYMQIEFFNHKDLCCPLHKHPFIEMHVFLSGTAVLKCDEQDFHLQEGDVLFIPANMLHMYKFSDEDSKRISFLIDCNNNHTVPNKTSLPKVLLSLLCSEIQNYALTGKDSKLCALLSYICSDFLVIENRKKTLPITNRKLIIEDFFSEKYNLDVTLDDLAKELMLSQKQTEREVKRITGNTFVGELIKRKINAAIILSQTTNLPLTKISELVGYSSYSGFYKAYRRALKHSANLLNK